MARDTTGVKAVNAGGVRQLNVKVPLETGEAIDRLRAACNVNLIGLVKMSVDFFSRAQETEQQGGKIIFVQADGTRHEVQLPRMEIRVKPEPSEAPEAPAAS